VDRVSTKPITPRLADETLVNNRGLARKDPLFARALALLVLAVALELVGVQ